MNKITDSIYYVSDGVRIPMRDSLYTCVEISTRLSVWTIVNRSVWIMVWDSVRASVLDTINTSVISKLEEI